MAVRSVMICFADESLMSYCASSGQHDLACFGGGWRHRSEMSHLSTGKRALLAIEMQLDTRIDGESSGPFRLAISPEISQQIGHRHGREKRYISKRQAADGAELLLELAGDAGVEAEVAGIVRARRQLI